MRRRVANALRALANRIADPPPILTVVYLESDEIDQSIVRAALNGFAR